MSYYRLYTDGAETVYMKRQPGLNHHIKLGTGRRWDEAAHTITLPFRYTMAVSRERAPRLYGWYPGSHLMQDRMIELLKKSGADNLQTFPAEIRHQDTTEHIHGYSVVNIVGRVSCANLEKSTTLPLADVFYFENLVIDEPRTNGLLIFRVHESPMLVLVHENVARAIEAARFEGLSLEAIPSR